MHTREEKEMPGFKGRIIIDVDGSGITMERRGNLDEVVIALVCLKVSQKILEQAVATAAGNDKMINVVKGSLIH